VTDIRCRFRPLVPFYHLSRTTAPVYFLGGGLGLNSQQ